MALYGSTSTQQDKLRVKQDLLTIIGLITNYLWNQTKQFNGKSCVSHDIFTIFKNIDSSSYLLCWKPHMGGINISFCTYFRFFLFPATRVDHVQVILNVFIFIYNKCTLLKWCNQVLHLISPKQSWTYDTWQYSYSNWIHG